MSHHLPGPGQLSAMALVAMVALSTVSVKVNDPVDPDAWVAQPQRGTRVSPPLPQSIGSSTTLVAEQDRNDEFRIESPRGARVWTMSDLASHNVPEAALAAYRNAAAALAHSDPACHLPWTLLAAIGRVESDHGRYAGSVVGTDGVARPTIIGVALDGVGPVAAIPDSDDGRLDGDTTWDRAVGPMQFIPTTWAWAGRDGDGDGVFSPHDLDDAALAAADYLCNGTDISGGAAMDAAIFRYNPSNSYVQLVRAFEAGYRTGYFVIPSPDVLEKDAKKRARQDKDGDGVRDGRDPDGGHGPTGDPSTDPNPTPGSKPGSPPSYPAPGLPVPILPPPPGTHPVAGPGPRPNDPTPNDPTPNYPTPNYPTPNDPTPNDPTPNDPTPNDPTPNDPTPNDPTPSDPAPYDPEPTPNEPDPTPNDPAPSQPEPDPTPNDPAPSDPAPSQPEPDPTPNDPTPSVSSSASPDPSPSGSTGPSSSASQDPSPSNP